MDVILGRTPSVLLIRGKGLTPVGARDTSVTCRNAYIPSVTHRFWSEGVFEVSLVEAIASVLCFLSPSENLE